MILATSAFSLSITLAGVASGANIAHHWLASKPGKVSATVGNALTDAGAFSAVTRCAPVTAMGRNLPAASCAETDGNATNSADTLPATRSMTAGGPPL